MHIETRPIQPIDVEAELNALAQRYRGAGGVGMAVLNHLGGQAEGLLGRLPAPLRDRLDGATERALLLALRASHSAQQVVGPQPRWLNTALSTVMGAAGGFGGLPSAMAELPVTTCVILGAIQGVAVEQGFDPRAENVPFDCLRVLASAGPLAHDDGSDLAFIATRLTLTGPTVQRLVASVAPRFAAALGQKLAAQTVPVLGAVAGAATNYAYTSYYQEMAHVHFGLRRLAIEADIPHAQLIEALRKHVAPSPAT
jgi:hypothetical protein